LAPSVSWLVKSTCVTEEGRILKRGVPAGASLSAFLSFLQWLNVIKKRKHVLIVQNLLSNLFFLIE